MSALPDIASLWIGGELTFLEQLCLRSYVRQGHPVTLYTYETVTGVPDGVQVADAAEIYDHAPMRVHFKSGSPAIQSDFFRLYLMRARPGVIWVDTDAYCHKPFALGAQGPVYGWQGDEVASGVLRLDPESATLRAMLDFLESDAPVPPFYPDAINEMLGQVRFQNFMIPLEAMPWGTTGPMALTHFLRETGEIDAAMGEQVFYPAPFKNRRRVLKPAQQFLRQLGPEVLSVHFYARIMKRILAEEFEGLPPEGSYLSHICEIEGIAPDLAPIPARYRRPGH